MDKAEFERGINSIKRDTNLFKRETDNLTRASERQNMAIGTGTKALTSMRSQYTQLNNQMGYYATKLKEEEAAGKKGQAQWSRYANQLQETSSKMANLTSQYDDFSKRLFTANSPFTKMGEGLETIGTGAINFGQGLEQVGSTITRIGAVATAGGAMFIKTAMDFEDGMVHIRKTTDMGTEELGVLENAIKDMAGEMPIAVEQLQNVAGIAGQLGVRGVENITHFTETMSKIGTATSLSAEEASEAIARFTNITGTGQTTIDNLGSSLVHLGNTLASTESEIMSMAGQLVGTLTTVGVGEADILGLSGAMSALGITAERGASSISKFFVDMAGAVSEGGEQLSLLAEAAGMTSDEFATMFNQDSMGAFEAFIGGLADVNASGGDLIKWMDDLGINEVRMRDTILKLANGYGILDEALKSSNEAYSEATALELEYQIMLESTSAQWELAKNSVKLFAIEIGQELLPVVLDLLNQAGGIKDMASNFVEWFKGLDDSIQNNIVKWGALSVVIGPAVSALGSIITIGGQVLTFVGGLSKGLGIIHGSLTAMKFGKITGEVVGFKGALSLLNPQVALVAASIVAVGGGLWAWRELTEEARLTNQALKDYPDITGITGEQAESLNKVKTSFEELDVAFNTLGTNSVGHSDTVIGAVNDIVTEINELNSDKLDDLNESLKDLPPDVQGAIQQVLSDSIGLAESQITRAQEIASEISSIYETAKQEQRDLHDFELQRVMGLEAELQGIYSRVLGNSFEQQQQIYANLTQGLADMTTKQLEERQFIILDYAQKEANTLKQAKEGLETAWQAGLITTNELSQGIEIAEKNYADNLRKLNISAVHTARERFDKLNEGFETSFDELVKFVQTATGLGFDEVISALQSEMPNFDASIKNMIGIVDEGVDGLQEAANKWDKAISDFALSKGVTPADLGTEHLTEFVEKALETGMTWEDMELLSKDASVDDNIRDFLNKTAEAQGGWEALKLEEHVAKINVFGMEELQKIVELFGVDFNSLTDTQKEALVNSVGYRELSDLLYEYGVWKSDAPAEPKQAVLETDQAMASFKDLFIQLGLWNDTEFLSHIAYIDTNAPDFQEKLAEAISEWTGIPVEEIKAMMVETNADEATESIEGTGQALNALGGRSATVTINAVDNASWQIQRISEQLSGINGRTATAYVTTLSTTATYAKGTNHHSGGLAILGDGGRREPFMTPEGTFGISPDKDTMYDLPVGTKVWSSINRFRAEAMGNSVLKPLINQIPKYAKGTDKSFLDEMKTLKVPTMGARGMVSNNEIGQSITDNSDSFDITININNPNLSNTSDMSKLEQQMYEAATRAIGKLAKNKKKGWSL